MIYLDNAATTRFKPQRAVDALLFDIKHSLNVGRNSHKENLITNMKIENCRKYLLDVLSCKDNYNLVFTKSCTEALNLAIFGTIKQGQNVVTTKGEHNAILRPLHYLQSIGKINLSIIDIDGKGHINIDDIKNLAKDNDIFILSYAQNVLGTYIDLEDIAKVVKSQNKTLIVDCAQSIPILDMKMADWNIDILCCSAHKGLHGIQGVGFMIANKDIEITPLIFGGTGTHSTKVIAPTEYPESYEAGTIFSGGICALYEASKWTYDNLSKIKRNYKLLASDIAYNLKNIGIKVYNSNYDLGIVSFNVKNFDSTYIADKLNDYDICVRAGFHCAPFIHQRLNTTSQGIVRASVGIDNSKRDVTMLSATLENIIKNI